MEINLFSMLVGFVLGYLVSCIYKYVMKSCSDSSDNSGSGYDTGDSGYDTGDSGYDTGDSGDDTGDSGDDAVCSALSTFYNTYTSSFQNQLTQEIVDATSVMYAQMTEQDDPDYANITWQLMLCNDQAGVFATAMENNNQSGMDEASLLYWLHFVSFYYFMMLECNSGSCNISCDNSDDVQSALQALSAISVVSGSKFETVQFIGLYKDFVEFMTANCNCSDQSAVLCNILTIVLASVTANDPDTFWENVSAAPGFIQSQCESDDSDSDDLGYGDIF